MFDFLLPTMDNIPLALITWYLIWFLYQGSLNFIVIKSGSKFSKNIWAVILNTLIFAVIAYLRFNKFFIEVNLMYVFGLAVVVTLIDRTFLHTHKKVVKKTKVKIKQRRIRSPLFSRAFDIMFQQMMVWTLFVISKNILVVGLPLITGFLFFLAHLPILVLNRIPLKNQLFIMAASLSAGIIFGYLLENSEIGYIFTYLVHFFFYYFYAMFTGRDDQITP